MRVVSRFSILFTALATSLATTARAQSTAAPAPALPIPPLAANVSTDASAVEFFLKAEAGRSSFLAGRVTPTYGYNDAYLGPTLRAKRGQHVRIHVRDALAEDITTHWHGMLLDGPADGGPQQGIRPGAEWVADFTVDQPAATLWYHPHPQGATGRLVYMGLAGLFIVDDDASAALPLPHAYGVDDVPLILQDKRFHADGTLAYATAMADAMVGMKGDVVLVNGAVAPVFETAPSRVRFRILNGSNARAYRVRVSDGSPMWLMGTDGGLVAAPVRLGQVTLSPGERAEVVVDLSGHRAGDAPMLVSGSLPLLTCRIVGPARAEQPALPERLAAIDWLAERSAQRTRSFALHTMGMQMAINGRQMDMARIDDVVRLHDTEVWTVTNQAMGMMGRGMGGGMGGMMGSVTHSFHVHGVQFQVLDRDGRPPPPRERGWKDTVALAAGETVRLVMRFDHAGVFMYRCHVLEHEDEGMMGQFEVR